MGRKNGYFQLVRNENGMSIRIYPPENGGDSVAYHEVVAYLEERRMFDVDVKSLAAAINKATENVQQIVLTLNPGSPTDEEMSIRFEDNNMKAVARFYPPGNDGKKLDKNAIISAVSGKGIKYGIREDEIDRFLKERQYCTDYVIAGGKEVRQGKNAEIKYYFNTDRRLRPKRNPDGSVDFHQLDNISHINKGDVIAELIPADMGEDGIDVFGKTIAPRKVQKDTLKYGKNISMSDDGLKLISLVDGHAMLEGNKVFVSNIYEVPADVDNSTGDISYEGNVIVKGSVRTGFKIRALGNVEVYGSVEGAEIVSGGDIILHHGMQGMSKGILVAKGNIVAKFIESTRVHSHGYIEVDAIIQSQVAARDGITVMGVKGNIIGGHVKSATYIKAKTIGSPMEVTTTVEVGVDPVIQEKIVALQQKIEEKNKSYKKMAQLVELFKQKFEAGKLTADKVEVYKKTLPEMQIVRNEMLSSHEELEQLSQELVGNDDAYIEAVRDVHPGVRMIIGGDMKIVNAGYSHCRFKKTDGEVKSYPV